MLLVWGRRDSFNVQKVMWLIDELQLPHQHIPAGGVYGGLDTPEFLAMNPHGRVPLISDEGHAVWDSHSILRYLAECYSKGQFWPKDPKEHSTIDSWMEWQHTRLQIDFLDGIFWGYYRTPANERNWTSINTCIERCDKHFLLLDKLLQAQSFLCGETLSLADICVGTTLYRYFELDIKKPAIPNVIAWYERLKKRDAYQKNVMLPFDHMYGKLY